MVTKMQLGGFVVYEKKYWSLGLKELGILRLLDIPNFGRSSEVNACIKQLLSCIHGGTFWMDEEVEITT